MKIELHETTVRELADGYFDNAEEGVRGYGGRLDIRPAYQREFVYKDKQRDAVIDTIVRGFPLNVMYWAKRSDGTYEVIDGQQRTISICQYIEGGFSVKIDKIPQYFYNLTEFRKKQILDYRLMVYICEGSDDDRLNWFRTINIAGEQLTDQELLNAVFAGSWMSDAKRYFSKPGCAAYEIGQDYMTGTPIRQEYLETAIKWISGGDIKGYMAKHQHDDNAARLWLYFQAVMTWVQATFPVKRKSIMKGVAWGELYNLYKDNVYNTGALEEEIKRLLIDDDVTAKKGIYPYVLTRNERFLSIRSFTTRQKMEVYERQDGVCPKCGKRFTFEEMQGDHMTPWSKGGRTVSENCQMLCRNCNRQKSDN